MGKFEKKDTGTAAKGFPVAVVLTVIAVVLVLFVLSRMGGDVDADFPEPETQGEQTQATSETEETVTGGESQPAAAPSETASADQAENTQPAATEPESTQPENTQSAAKQPEIVMPFLLEGGKLEVHSLFQSAGINPDYGNEEGDDIATIMLINTSDFMLSEATITVQLADGTQIRFLVTSLPAEATAMAFSVDNITLADDAICVGITCEAKWNETRRTIPEGVSVSVDGMEVTITNNTAQNISELIIYCRTPFGEEYFGGMAYEYTINDLPANGSTTFVAEDCIMGLAEVVRIEIVR